MDVKHVNQVPGYPFTDHAALTRSLDDGTAQLMMNLGNLVTFGLPSAKIPTRAISNYLRMMMAISILPFASIIFVLIMGNYWLLLFSALYLFSTFMIPVAIVQIRPLYLGIKILTFLFIAAAMVDYPTFSNAALFMSVILCPISTKYNAFLLFQEHVLKAIKTDESAFDFLFSNQAIAVVRGGETYIYPGKN